MKPGSEHAVGIWIPIEPSLETVLARLEALSLEPAFLAHRQLAMTRALRPYADYAATIPLKPLPEEIALANLFLYCDFLPADGQPSLVEQVRDTITTHVPEEERAWLDPLRHSYMDLLEMVDVTGTGERATVALRSLGDGRQDQVPGGDWTNGLHAGQVLLTRVIRQAQRAVLPGTALVLSGQFGRAVYQRSDQWRRGLEAQTGSFGLGEWSEFAKGYGYVLLWNFAQVGLEALSLADRQIRFVGANGQPFLYALALYEHNEFRLLSRRFAAMEGFVTEGAESRPERAAEGPSPALVWVQRDGRPQDASAPVVVRVTLTPVHVIVECDSTERLDRVKHLLASAFGFSLHFRGESTGVPAHELPEVDLTEGVVESQAVIVSPEEDQRIVSAFLDSVYLEWADRASPALGGQTPRHAASNPASRAQVAALIDQVERDDLARRRTGRPGFDYAKLRAHVGL
jgi:hypothetical protein